MRVRLPRKNKQNMKYALQGETVEIYERDENGNIIYDSVGDTSAERYPSEETYPAEDIYPTVPITLIPIKAGYKLSYDEPTDFSASIAFGSNEADAREFGYSTADFDATITAVRNEFPLEIGTLIWFESEVEYDANGLVEETSADYRVLAKKPTLTYEKFLLKAVQHG